MELTPTSPVVRSKFVHKEAAVSSAVPHGVIYPTHHRVKCITQRAPERISAQSAIHLCFTSEPTCSELVDLEQFALNIAATLQAHALGRLQHAACARSSIGVIAPILIKRKNDLRPFFAMMCSNLRMLYPTAHSTACNRPPSSSFKLHGPIRRSSFKCTRWAQPPPSDQ